MLRRPQRLLVALCAATVTTLGAGCGAPAPDTSIPPAVRWCPKDPTDRRFETRRLLGLPFQDARRLAGQYGCEIVTVRRDGEDLIVDAMYSDGRIDVETRDGIVMAILTV